MDSERSRMDKLADRMQQNTVSTNRWLEEVVFDRYDTDQGWPKVALIVGLHWLK